MPKNKANDPITDQEIAFALLVLSGTMTDRRAAEAAGLNPDTAAYIKSKPCVRAYMLEHRAAVQQPPVEQQAEGSHRFHVGREQVLDRLWELAVLGPEVTRGSITGQIKAISIIVAIEGMIPDRRAGSTQMNSAPLPPKPQIYVSAWRREQQQEAAGLRPNPDHAQEDHEEDKPRNPEAEAAFGSVEDAPPAPSPIPSPVFNPSEPTFADRVSLKETQWVPDTAFERDTRVPFSIPKGLFPRRRR